MSSSGSRPWIEDRGSGSVLTLGVLAVLLVITTTALAVAGALGAAHRARAAADLAALATAQDYLERHDPASACSVGRGIAGRNGSEVVDCSVTADGIATLSTRTAVTLRLAGISPTHMRGEARAGPEPGAAPPARHT